MSYRRRYYRLFHVLHFFCSIGTFAVKFEKPSDMKDIIVSKDFVEEKGAIVMAILRRN